MLDNIQDLIDVAEEGYIDMKKSDPTTAGILRRLIDRSKGEVEILKTNTQQAKTKIHSGCMCDYCKEGCTSITANFPRCFVGRELQTIC